MVTLFEKAQTLVQLYEQKSKSEPGLRPLASAFQTYQLIADVVERARLGYRSDQSKLLLGDKARRIFENAIAAALELHATTQDRAYLESAFAFSQESKAVVLADAVREARAKRFAGIPDSLLERERRLRTRLSYFDRKIQEAQQENEEAAEWQAWRTKYFELQRDYEGLIGKFEAEYPRYYDLKYQPQMPSLSEIQAYLQEDHATLLDYFLGDSTLYVFVIKENGLQVVESGRTAAIAEDVSRLRRALANLEFESYLTSAWRLYRQLVAPLAERGGLSQKLIFIPDGILNYLPFEALLTESVAPERTPDFAKLPYLIREHEVRYHFSATLLTQLYGEIAGRGGVQAGTKVGFAGFAPIFDDELPPTIESSWRSPGFAKTAADTPAARSISIGEKRFAALPESEKEVRTIAALFQQQSRPANLYLRECASERRLKAAELKSVRYLHLATHGLINEEQPALSGILFMPPESSDSGRNNGILYSGEIYNLDLNAEVVVLSACESGLGQVVRGEGIIGLTRGFIYAGVQNVVVSLWQVADASTSELMVRFYERLLQGHSIAAALRSAKLELISEGEYAYPLDWSPFILVGE